ncbi:MAG: efflux RND transporter permease subunit, partial [Candidatus Sericytochromatia bacterium]|nr:efflux RND transporter permease subunit [Candidatus Tanganyikabacteria bacterium]
EQTPVTTRNGRPILVRDLATVVDGYADLRSTVLVGGVPSLQLRVNKQTGTNTVQVAEGIVRAVAAMDRDLRGVRVVVTNDTSRFIRRAMDHLAHDLLYGSILAFGVILFFLGNLRSTLIVATAIPVSVVATFLPLYFQGFSLNTMSLGGLALGVGRLVDDSIVVIENIFRHRKMGKSAAQAALDGTRQVSLAIVASTLTTVAVFVPLVFLAGMSGVLFSQLAFVVAFALLCSLVVAQGLVPMLCARFLADPAPPRFAPVRALHGATGRFSDALMRVYEAALRGALRSGWAVLAVALVLTVGSAALLPRVGSEFMPQADEGEVRISGEAAPGTTLEELTRKFEAVERIVRDRVPERILTIAELGGATGFRPAAGNTGSLRLLLTPVHERARSSEEIAQALRRELDRLPGLRCRVQASGGSILNRLLTGGGGDGGRIAVQIRGHDLTVASRLAEAVQNVMNATPGVANVRLNRDIGSPEVSVSVDRMRAAAVGVSAAQVARALEAAVLGLRATALREQGDEIPVIVRLRETDRSSLDQVLATPLQIPGGRVIRLGDVVTVGAGVGPSRIDRDNQERIIAVTGEPEGRDVGGIVARLQQNLGEIAVPTDFQVVVQGDWEEQQKAFRDLTIALVMALLLILLIMVAQFESIRAPFAILLSVPASITGVVVALLATGTTLNV